MQPISQLLERFQSMEKEAQAKMAEGNENSAELTGVPGSEHDQKVPASAKKDNKEVAQGQPAGAGSISGAVVGGDAKPLNEGKMEIDQAVLTPTKKPTESSDANAKTASASVATLTNELLAEVVSRLNKTASDSCAGGTCAPAPVPAPVPAPAAKKDDKKDEGKKDEGKKDEKPKSEAKPSDATKTAANPIVFDESLINKIAAAVVAYQQGQTVAAETVKAAAAQDAIDYQKGAAAAQNLIMKIAQDAGAIAPDASAAPATDPANAVQAGTDGSGSQDTELPPDTTKEELGQALVDLVSDGSIPPEAAEQLVSQIAGGSDDAGATGSDDQEQAASIVADALQSGEISPDQAEQIASAISGENGSPAPDATSEDGAGDAGAADAEQAAQDARDEAQGAADADQAMKAAAAEYPGKQASSCSPKAKAFLDKVAGCLIQKQAAAADPVAQYQAGFIKKAQELGLNPGLLAQYALRNQGK